MGTSFLFLNPSYNEQKTFTLKLLYKFVIKSLFMQNFQQKRYSLSLCTKRKPRSGDEADYFFWSAWNRKEYTGRGSWEGSSNSSVCKGLVGSSAIAEWSETNE
jgi:hypothetical protein